MHELPCTVIVTVDVNVQPEDVRPERTGQENVVYYMDCFGFWNLFNFSPLS